MKAIGNIISPKIAPPDAPPPPPSPTSQNQAVAQQTNTAMTDAATAQRNAQGRASTILTSGSGLLDPAPVSRRTLLGV